MKREKVLFLATHPDDETLGCGGAILKHKARGHEVYWVIATDMTKESGFDRQDMRRREKEIYSVARLYGFKKVFRLGMPTTAVDRIPAKEVVAKISGVFKRVKPSIVYIPFRSDVHSDHRVIFEAAFGCAKSFRCPFIKKILMMEIISETEFTPALKETVFMPNYFVDISDFLKKKIEIAKIYKSELGRHPFPRSLKNIKALAISRGALAGCKYAEAFMLLKQTE